MPTHPSSGSTMATSHNNHNHHQGLHTPPPFFNKSANNSFHSSTKSSTTQQQQNGSNPSSSNHHRASFSLTCTPDGPQPTFMPKPMIGTAVPAKIYISGQRNHRRVTLTIESSWSFTQFFKELRKRCQFSDEGKLTVKWLDDEDDPCTISSQLEYDEAIRHVISARMDVMKVHVFNGEPRLPGQRPPGENKAMYRKNARRLAKFKRLFSKKSQKPSIEDPYQTNKTSLGISNPIHLPQTTQHTIDSFEQQGAFGLKDFELIKVIGRGSYAKVLLCRLKSSKQLYAMKVIKKETIADEEDVDWVNTEKKVFEQATNHAFLVGMHSCFQTVSRLFFVIEYVNGGDLMFHMQRQRKLPEDHARFYSAEIVLALTFLHSRFIIYRDLKLDNVLLDCAGHIKLTDYGMCKEGMIGENAKTTTFCGTPNYIAPEILRGNPYGFSVDWWALGVLMYEMMAGKSPFDLNGMDQQSAENTEEALFQVILERPIRMPRSLSIPASKVLKKFLDKQPETRLGCTGLADIQSDSFFRNLDWQRLAKKQVIPPFKPTITDEFGLENFDSQFTEEVPRLTPDDPETIAKINQAEFEDFNYHNPLLLNTGKAV